MIFPAVLAILILAAALGAAWFARPVHAALALALSLALLAVLQIGLGAGFVGLVQFMVYVGAVAVLILFALLMTNREDEPAERAGRRCAWVVALASAVPAGAAIATCIPSILAIHKSPPAEAPPLALEQIGRLLFTTHAASVLGVGVLLTAVLIGAALIARDPSQHQDPPP